MKIFTNEGNEEDNRETEMDTTSDHDEYPRIFINEENVDLATGSIHSEVVNLPVIQRNEDEDLGTTLNSILEKISSLHEDFQQFKLEIRRETKKNTTKILEILAILKDKYARNKENDEEIVDLLPDFPLTSVEEYMQFNEKLKNDETIRKCFDKRIKHIGGDSVQKMTSNILCITFDVGHKLSWTGDKNTVAIENSTFANIIIGAVSQTKGLDCTISLVVKYIKNWLQHAGDKIRYRMKKIQGAQ